MVLLPASVCAHELVDVVTSASRSANPARACDYDRDGAIRNDRYCQCNDAARAGPNNYSRRGSREFCACDPATQHCDPDGTYSDGTPRYRWTIDCNDFDRTAYPQHCAPIDCNANYQQHPHCAAAVVDEDGDGYSEDDCDDGDAAVHPGAEEICGDGIDQDCSGADERCVVTDADGDGARALAAGGDDCDDNDPEVHPGAAERCGNGRDEDCDGVDPPCVADRDRDGFEDAAGGGEDCDDLNSGRHPGAVEVPGDGVDQDCDGADATMAQADVDGDGFLSPDFGGGDCDDHAAAVHPGAPELCGDGVDQNCDGADLSCAATSDLDGDGDPAGEDCDDRSSAIHPGAPEVCGDGVDQDCSGADLPCDGLDRDGGIDVGADKRTTNRGDNPSGCAQTSEPVWSVGLLVLLAVGVRRRRGVWVLALGAAVPAPADAGCVDLDNDGHQILFFDQCGDDCNDLDPAIHPGAAEVCGDMVDQDCDGQIDEGCMPAGDADGDGVPAVAAGGTDCNDADSAIHPGARDVCGDGVDQDCSGADAVCAMATDADGDGVLAERDCDDHDPARHPGAVETCGDGVDQDCSGADAPCPASDEADADGDGHLATAQGGDDCDDLDASTYPGAPERCGDGRDQDCDGADAPCDHDHDGFAAGMDCDDFVAAIHPNAEEICGDGVDQDCNGADLDCADLPAVPDADGDGHLAVSGGGDDCQDFDRAAYPGAPEICGDGVDQDCDGQDLPCGSAEVYVETDADPFVRRRASAAELPSGSGVPDGPTTSCAAVPGSGSGGAGWWVLLGLACLGGRRRSLALVPALLAGCGEVDNPVQTDLHLDPEFYAAFVDPILARGCATPACHGNPDRPLHLFSVSRLRAAGRAGIDTELTDDELCRNLVAVQGFVRSDAPEGSTLIAKPLYLEDGGTWHGGGYHFGPGDPEYACLVRWVRGETVTANADGRLVGGCDLAWNVAADGELIVPERRGLQCD